MRQAASTTKACICRHGVFAGDVWGPLLPMGRLRRHLRIGQGVGITRSTDHHGDLLRMLHLAQKRPKHMQTEYVSVQVNICDKNGMRPHKDKFNYGCSSLTAMGNFVGGELWYFDPAGTIRPQVTPRLYFTYTRKRQACFWCLGRLRC
eukprot:4798332-Amphidinium_carterae.1